MRSPHLTEYFSGVETLSVQPVSDTLSNKYRGYQRPHTELPVISDHEDIMFEIKGDDSTHTKEQQQVNMYLIVSTLIETDSSILWIVITSINRSRFRNEVCQVNLRGLY